ncbi:hypothetical protein CEXT_780901 [Caerostris extrusa]|uniref:Uncharacterized protein n=1 Tax=Caerostris extrusa TaxID=172846 RepID=A0AAV4YDE3_CAEEX|nr:hypothetical protein CEXT_780901 [Caerostris extrusa]
MPVFYKEDKNDMLVLLQLPHFQFLYDSSRHSNGKFALLKKKVVTIALKYELQADDIGLVYKNEDGTSFTKPLSDLQKAGSRPPPAKILTENQFQSLEVDNPSMQIEETVQIVPRLSPVMVRRPNNKKELL